MKKILNAGVCAAVIAASLSGTVAYACYNNNGTTSCGGGSSNFLVLCNLPVNFQNCTGTGNPVTETDFSASNSGSVTYCGPYPSFCTWTAYFNGKCCGGAVTHTTAISAYWYYNACGGSCNNG